MQKSAFLKVCIVTGLVTAGIVVLYEVSDQLLVYHYFKFEYYVTGIGVAALATGVLLANRYHKNKPQQMPVESSFDKLTARELRVLEQIAAGLSNKEIAALNYVELSTVKTHINNIYTKLGANNRKEVIKLYGAQPGMQKSTLSPPSAVLDSGV